MLSLSLFFLFLRGWRLDGWMDQKALVLILSRRCLPCPSRSHLAVAVALSSFYCRILDFPTPDARPLSSAPPPLSSPCTTHHRIDPGPEYHNILLLQLITGLIIFLSLSRPLLSSSGPNHHHHHSVFFSPYTLVSPRYQSTPSENHENTYRYFFFLHSTLRFRLCFFLPLLFELSIATLRTVYLHSLSIRSVLPARSSHHHHDIHFFPSAVFSSLLLCTTS
ncbi:hypothetical protein R3P38DRAFT_3008371 [Favolaschia claudopus]|uniref:Uncharacterized protein n=1 Tax=Favolaschia claudopus TaxID=2862362 RepID=A0AAW0AM21_9AGAR